MSVPAVTITRDGPEAVPFAYTLAAREAFRPDTISAVFNGSGAGADFLPCCSIYTQDGSLLARCPTPSTIVAGDVSEVTFAPPLRSSPAAASTPAQWASAEHFLVDASQAIPSGGVGTYVQWNHFFRSDSAVTSLGMIVSGTDGVDLAADYMYLVMAFTNWENAAYGRDMRLQPAAFQLQQTSYNQLDSANAGALYGQPWLLQDLQMVKVNTNPTQIGVLVHNYDVVPRNIVAAGMSIFAWPNAESY